MGASLALISSMATRHILAELADLHARRSGSKIALEAVGGVEAARRVGAGEAFDLVVLASGAMAKLDAHLLAGSRVDVALSGMGPRACRSRASSPTAPSTSASSS